MSREGLTVGSEEPGGAAPWLFSAWGLVTALWFAFAFAPSGDPSLAWLKSAQIACFGSREDGLPSDWGWVVMVLAPLSMLAGLLAAYLGELRAWAKTRRMAVGLALAAAAAVFLAESRWIALRLRAAGELQLAYETAPERGPLPEGYPRLAEAVPPFHLIDQRGAASGPESFRGAPTVLCFIFADCKAICPFQIRDALLAARAVPGSRAAFITLDPWRDTPGALPGIAKRYGMGPESRLISGEPEKVRALLKGLGVDSLRDPLTGEILHPSLVLVLDAKGRIAYRFNRPSVAWLSEALRRLGAEG